MQNRLNPPSSLENNKEIYNTFLNTNSNQAFVHLNQLYESYSTTPLSFTDRLEEIYKLPDYALVYLMVEIRLMKKEGNCFKFEDREPGCLHAYFEGLSSALENINDFRISHSLFKTEHRQCTKKVQKMSSINEKTSGEYRPADETLVLPPSDVSVNGIEYLIGLIEKRIIKNLKIVNAADYYAMDRLLKDSERYKFMSTLLSSIATIDTTSEDTIIQSISLFTKKKNIDEEISLYFDQLNVLSKLQTKLPLEENQLNDELFSANTLTQIIRAIQNVNRYSAELVEQLSLEYEQIAINRHKEAMQYTNSFLSEETIKDMLSKQNIDRKELAKQFFNRLITDKDDLIFIFPQQKEIENAMNMVIKSYNSQVEQMKNRSLEKKIFFLYQHIQMMLLIHPFADGNNRTFVNTFALRAHLQLGIPLPMHFNPFVFYAHTPGEITEAIKLSCANFLAVKDNLLNKKDSPFSFMPELLSTDALEKLSQFTAPLRFKISKLLIADKIKKYIEDHSVSEQTKSGARLFEKRYPSKPMLSHDLEIIDKCKTKEDLNHTIKMLEMAHKSRSEDSVADLYHEMLASFIFKNRADNISTPPLTP